MYIPRFLNGGPYGSTDNSSDDAVLYTVLVEPLTPAPKLYLTKRLNLPILGGLRRAGRIA